MTERNSYRNFTLAIYCTNRDVKRMADQKWLESSFNEISKHVKIDKVYLENFRESMIVDKDTMLKVKSFFESKGIKTSGGMATYLGENHRFKSWCYTRSETRETIKKVVRDLAEIFDEFIIDDLFFENCKCEECIKAKGSKSWKEYRLELMEEISRDVIIKTAREVNPNIRIILKYPNFYEHFQFVGYNLEVQPKLFDMIYTGTETRDPDYTMQHLQEYQSYLIMRLLENTKPGGNGGGWIDPLGRRTLDRYAEQIRLTLFAKPREITLFSYGILLEFIRQSDGSYKPVSTLAAIAGRVLDETDSFLDKLGKPYGIPSYKPFNSSGEDFLHNYIGMIGIPLEITPVFPNEADTVLLTECAKFDPNIVEKIKNFLIKGGTVIMTSGLLSALKEEVLRELVAVEYTDKKALVKGFTIFESWLSPSTHVYYSDTPIIIPQLKYATNDAWEFVTALDKGSGYPILLQTKYANGTLYILTIPDNFSDLYHLPEEILTYLRRLFMSNMKVYMEGPSRICMFLYDNDSFILHSFLPNPASCNVIVKGEGKIRELRFNFEPKGFKRDGEKVFSLMMWPYSYMVFKIE
ncbi:MAG: permease [Thermoproteota archaeon]